MMTAPDIVPDIVVERTIAATPERIWPYISTGELWVRWQGEHCTIEPIPGGAFRMRMPDGAVASGTVIEVDAPRRIVFTWGWTGTPFALEPGSTTVEITLETQAPNVTKMTLVHKGIPADLRDHHEQGWIRCIGQIPA